MPQASQPALSRRPSARPIILKARSNRRRPVSVHLSGPERRFSAALPPRAAAVIPRGVGFQPARAGLGRQAAPARPGADGSETCPTFSLSRAVRDAIFNDSILCCHIEYFNFFSAGSRSRSSASPLRHPSGPGSWTRPQGGTGHRQNQPTAPRREEIEMPKAIRITETGGPEVIRWEDVEVGEPGEGQARVRHTAVGVNLHRHLPPVRAVPDPAAERAGERGGRGRRGGRARASRSSSPATGWRTPAARPGRTPRRGCCRPASWSRSRTG